MKHLNPKTPASCSPRRSSMLPGIAPPQKPTSTCAVSCAAFRLISSPSTVVVGGMLFSGMSRIVVTPPAAAARVAVAKPSHSVRPGSLTCTWLSTRPGSSTSSSARSTVSVALEPRLERLDRDHDPVADGDAAGHLTGPGDHPAAAEDQIEVGHRSAHRLAR